MALSEDEQRVLDALERQLRTEGSRADAPGDTRVRRIAEVVDVTPSSVPAPLLGVGAVVSLGLMAVAVLIGGIVGVALGWLAFAALVACGVALVQRSRDTVTEQVQTLIDRYQSPPAR
jgi:hypothetical protein